MTSTERVLFHAYLVAFRSSGVPANAMNIISEIARMADQGGMRPETLDKWAYVLKYAAARLA